MSLKSEYVWVADRVQREFPGLTVILGEYDWGTGVGMAVRDPATGRRNAMSLRYHHVDDSPGAIGLGPLLYDINQDREAGIEKVLRLVREWLG